MKACEICGNETPSNYWKYCEAHSMFLRKEKAKERMRLKRSDGRSITGTKLNKGDYDLILDIEQNNNERFELLKELGVVSSGNPYFNRFTLK